MIWMLLHLEYVSVLVSLDDTAAAILSSVRTALSQSQVLYDGCVATGGLVQKGGNEME